MIPTHVSCGLFRDGALAAVGLAAGDVRVRIDLGTWSPRAIVPSVSEGVLTIATTAEERAAEIRLDFRIHDQDGTDFDDVLVTLYPMETNTVQIHVPLALSAPAQPAGHVFALRVGAQGYVLSVPIYDAEGGEYDLSGKTLRFVFEPQSAPTDVIALTPTVAETDSHLLQFVVPASLTASERTLKWTLWDRTDGVELPLAEGLCHVEWAAVEDA